MARNRLLRRARDETLLRYGAEVRGLRGLLREARKDLRLNIRAEEGAAAGIKAATKEALPEIRRSYSTAGRSAQTADSDVSAALAGLSPAADKTRAIAASESAAAKTRLAEALARTEADLGRRAVEAESARAYGVKAAQGQYQGERGKIVGQQRDLEQEMGLYAATTYRDLTDAQAKLNLEKRRVRISLGQLGVSRQNAAETRRHNRQTEANARAEERRLREKAGEKEGPPRGAITKHQDLIGSIQDTRKTVERLRKQGDEWGDIAAVLTLPDSADNPYGGKGELVTQAAIQLARDGKVSQGTLRALRARGLLVRRTPRTWKTEPPPGGGGGAGGGIGGTIGLG